jgi:uncharacterized protein YjiK
VALLAGLVASTGCSPGRAAAAALADSAEVARRAARMAGALARPDSGGAAVALWVLPKELAEISGLALTADGRLFAHDDERGRVSEIDYRRGVLVKQFAIGTPTVHADFEAIAIAHDRFYLLASDGVLYEFGEGAEGAQVAYTVHDTRLGHECEFEGLAFDPTLDALLLACKHVGTPRLRQMLVIYRLRLGRGSGEQMSTLTVPLVQVIGANGWKGLHPSDITVDPASGNYVLVSAEEQALVEITPAGEVVVARPLAGSLKHTEGVAITADGLLLLSDEAGQRPASITLYRWR